MVSLATALAHGMSNVFKIVRLHAIIIPDLAYYHLSMTPLTCPQATRVVLHEALVLYNSFMKLRIVAAQA